MLTNPLITAVAEQHRRDLITGAGPGSSPAGVEIDPGKKVRHGN